MIENQNKEFKTIWKDEYLAWICAFANSDGGVLYIGVDDNGQVVGVQNVKKLLKDIPNKIKSTLDILPKVSALQYNDVYYLEIVVNKYSSVVSYQGKIFVRSGSNTLELTGLELERFLLMNHGRK